MDDVIQVYRHAHPEFSASDVFFAATRDSRDWRPALVEMERRAALPSGAAPTYSYELHWGSPVDPKMKAHHALDVPLLFDNEVSPNRLSGKRPEAQQMGEIVSETYIAFARTVIPTTRKFLFGPRMI